MQAAEMPDIPTDASTPGRLPIGVKVDRRRGNFVASLFVNGRSIFLGRHPTPEAAGSAYRLACVAHGVDMAERERSSANARARWERQRAGEPKAGKKAPKRKSKLARRHEGPGVSWDRREAWLRRDTPLTPEQQALITAEALEDAQRVASALARKHPRLEDDLISKAMMTLVKSARRWDAGKHGAFRDYARRDCHLQLRAVVHGSKPYGYRHRDWGDGPAVESLDGPVAGHEVSLSAALPDPAALSLDDLMEGLSAIEEREMPDDQPPGRPDDGPGAAEKGRTPHGSTDAGASKVGDLRARVRAVSGRTALSP